MNTLLHTHFPQTSSFWELREPWRFPQKEMPLWAAVFPFRLLVVQKKEFRWDESSSRPQKNLDRYRHSEKPTVADLHGWKGRDGSLRIKD